MASHLELRRLGAAKAGRRRRRGARAEAGAALILALAFLTVVLTVVLVLFFFARTTTRTLVVYRQERVIRYTADAAIQAGIEMVKSDRTLGTTPTDLCNLQVPIQQPVTPTVAAGSTVTVQCPASAGTQSGAIAPDGGPQARDVTFTVICSATAATSTTLAKCGPPGTGTVDQVVARARVRFDIDYYYSCPTPVASGSPPTTAAPPNHTPPYANNPCTQQTVDRARIPRVQWWTELKCPAAQPSAPCS